MIGVIVMNGLDWSQIYGGVCSGCAHPGLWYFWNDLFLPFMTWDVIKGVMGTVAAIALMGYVIMMARRVMARLGL